MSISKKISRIIFVCAWVLAGGGLVVLLVAAMNSRKSQVCKGYEIVINSKADGKWFIDKAEVVDILISKGATPIRNKSIAAFNLAKIESQLKSDVWIRDADLYFDNNGVLRVTVDEREPISRVIAESGESFYLDSTGHKLPLSEKMTARLPVFTGFPSNLSKWKSPSDKKLVKEIKDISLFLQDNPFWMAQVSQIDITPEQQFEIVPTVGNHIVEFGDGSDCEKKFNRLFVFYKQVLAKAGMEKYSRIKVQYENEIVGVKKEDQGRKPIVH